MLYQLSYARKRRFPLHSAGAFYCNFAMTGRLTDPTGMSITHAEARASPTFDPVNPNKGDFASLEPKLSNPAVAGFILGTPAYFSGMSSLCKVFIDQCTSFRKKHFALKNKVVGVVAVDGVRNGGQELAIESVQAALRCQEMIVVGDGSPTAHTGATVPNDGKDDISGDEFGLNTVRNLGRRVAEAAPRMAR